MEKDKRLMEASWWESLTEGETGSCSDGQMMLSKSFIEFFCWWVGLCSLPIIYLGPNYGGGNEDNGDLLQLLLSVPQALQQARADPRLHWRLLTLTDTSGSFSYRVTPPFSWVLAHSRFCLWPPRICFPVLCKFLWLYGGCSGDLIQEGLCITQVCCTQSPWPCGSLLLAPRKRSAKKQNRCLRRPYK